MGAAEQEENKINGGRFMKRIVSIICISLLVLFHVQTVYAKDQKDANWYMWHGDQDALILGTITNVDGSTISLQVEKRLSGKGVIDETFRQIPDDEIADHITIKDCGSYQMSYHQKVQPEEGDFIIVSLEKEGDIWVAKWEPFEVSSVDYQSAEFLPIEKENGLSFAWTTFLRTDGRMNDFTFAEQKDGAKVIGRGVFDDGKLIEEVIYETSNVDFETRVTFVKSIPGIVFLVCIIAILISVISLIVIVIKKICKRK